VAVLEQAERRTDTEHVAGWLLGAAAVEFAVLAVTGVFLIFFYRPSAANAWPGVKGLHTAVTVVGTVRLAHRLTSYLFGLTLLALAVVGVVLAVSRSRPSHRHRMTAAGAVGAAILGFAASFTGLLLPWDQLALWSVTIGTNMMGYRPILDPSLRVQYVLIGGATISVDTLRGWFYIHVLLIPALLIGVGLLITWRVLRRPDQPDGHTGLGSWSHGPDHR
jgi:quinol-cytochrome oxidoreductase complex cytochrome b subunit